MDPDIVDVWAVPLACVRNDVGILAEQEREHARSFRSTIDQARYVAAHTALRRVLAGYLPVGPDEVELAAGVQGKPHIVAPVTDIRFNMARTRELAVVVVTRGREVGVDVEQVPSRRFDRPLAAAVLSPAEHLLYRVTPSAAKVGLLARIWTRKEAIVKADGRGLSIPLRRITCLTRRPRGAVPDLREFRVRGLRLGRDHLGAVAVEGTGWKIRRRQVPPSLSGSTPRPGQDAAAPEHGPRA